jgi:hypothetical protein
VSCDILKNIFILAVINIHNNILLLQLENKELPSKLKVKISGDGAKMTRLSNFMLLSFSFLQTEENVLSSKGKYY